MKRLVLSAAVLAGAALVGCEQSITPPDISPESAAFAKGGNGNGNNGGDDGGDGGTRSECGGRTDLIDSRATLDWSADDAIAGDASGDLFTGDAAGVHAKIFYHDAGCSRSGDLVFDADMNGKGRQARHLTFRFPANDIGLSAAEQAAPFVNFRAIMQLGSDVNGDGELTDGRDAKIEAKSAGAPRGLEHPATTATMPGYAHLFDPDRKFRFAYTGIDGCEYLEYERVVWERTSSTAAFQPTGGVAADGLPLGQWSHAAGDLGTWTVGSAETTDGAGNAGHWAQCLVSSGGSTVANGAPMHMPFTVSVTEVR